jgi:hypothetical protein
MHTMAIDYPRGTQAPSGPLVADRNLYLDATGTKIVEEGDAASASQLVARGHTINQADADRLGLVQKGKRVEQDRAVKIEEHQQLVDDLQAERKAFYEKVEQYQRENSTKDIPNTMEAARVALETRYEHAVLALGQFKKLADGKDPQRGESQATSVRPETSDVAREATTQANAAVAASPSPVDLAKAAPSGRAEVSEQHPDVDAAPSPNASSTPVSGAAAVKAEGDKPAAKKSARKSAAKKSSGGK